MRYIEETQYLIMHERSGGNIMQIQRDQQTDGDLNMLHIRKEKKVVFALKIFPSNRDSRGANMTEVLCLLTFHNLCICYSQVFPFETSSDYLIFLSASCFSLTNLCQYINGLKHKYFTSSFCKV